MQFTERRAKIISYLQEFLEPHPHVYAFWLEGADARNKVDEFSDIDLWLDVEDGHEENVLMGLEQHLRNLAPLDVVYKKPHPHPQIRQWFFHLANTSEFLLLDVCVQSHSREVEFGPNDPVTVLFDKDNVIRFRAAEPGNVTARAREILAEVALYKIWVLKAVKREQWLEALSYYHDCILQPLVTALRLHYRPDKADYGFKHVDEDLPPEVVERLEALSKLTSWGELENHLQQAVTWLEAVVKELELKHES
jgi:predicted nucleotidyltransferase